MLPSTETLNRSRTPCKITFKIFHYKTIHYQFQFVSIFLEKNTLFTRIYQVALNLTNK